MAMLVPHELGVPGRVKVLEASNKPTVALR